MRAGLLVAALIFAREARTSTQASPPCDRAHVLRVLFVGNSFTYFHNVPALVRGIAEGLAGPCIETSMIAIGGAMLEDHWKSDSVVRRIGDGHWTHVVLNDQSSFGEAWFLEGKARVGTSGRELADFGSRFAEVIHRAGATPVFLAHWADADEPARDQQSLDHLVTGVARTTRSAIAPAGDAIKRMQAELPTLTPYFVDRHHLAPAGAYLETLVLYAVMTARSPIGAPRRIEGASVELNQGTVHPDSVVTLVELSESQAAEIQRIADAETHSPRGAAPEPKPLSDEFPTISERGESVQLESLRGVWHGTSRVLPNPAGDSVAIDLRLDPSTDATRADSLHLRAGPIHFAGPATFRVEGQHVVIHASVTAQDAAARRSAQPLAVELRAVVHAGVMNGVATIQQRFPDTRASFDAIGRFDARRTSEPR